MINLLFLSFQKQDKIVAQINCYCCFITPLGLDYFPLNIHSFTIL